MHLVIDFVMKKLKNMLVISLLFSVVMPFEVQASYFDWNAWRNRVVETRDEAVNLLLTNSLNLLIAVVVYNLIKVYYHTRRLNFLGVVFLFITIMARAAISRQKNQSANYSKNNRLLNAVTNDDLVQAEREIRSGANVNVSLRSVCTADEKGVPIGIAISNGNLEMLKLLVSHGADVNAKQGRNTTSMPTDHDADADPGENRAWTSMRVSRDADVNAKHEENTILMFAVQYRFANQYNPKEIVEFLLSNNVNINIEDSDGKTALKHAIETKNIIARWPRPLNAKVSEFESKSEEIIDLLKKAHQKEIPGPEIVVNYAFE